MDISRRIGIVWRSFGAKLVLLAAVFVAVPLVLYGQFRAADAEKRVVLMQQVQDEGELIARALVSSIDQFDRGAGNALPLALGGFTSRGRSLKLLYRPNDGRDRYFYIAAAPQPEPEYLERERSELVATGVLDKLGDTCAGNRPLAVRYVTPAGREEVLSSLTPITTAKGCWVLITAETMDGFVAATIARPYWKTPEVRLAAVIYLAMAGLITWLFIDIWHNLRGFEARAREIRTRRAPGQSFSAVNRVPELRAVAQEFDRMTNALQESAELIREAAEQNAHALKAPLAVIAQSVEPLRARLAGDVQGRRAIERIDQSVARLDSLISLARRMDEDAAALLDPPRHPVDASALIQRMAKAISRTVPDGRTTLRAAIESGIVVSANEELIETVVENLIDNAVGFSPPGGTVTVSLVRNGTAAACIVEDEGPGVPPGELERIFERYVSLRGNMKDNDGQAHYGIGLSIVRRCVEAIGGSVRAENRPAGGMKVIATLPLAS